jgi:hypothetical protein
VKTSPKLIASVKDLKLLLFQKRDGIYRPEYPALSNHETLTDVNVSIDIISVDRLDSIEMSFDVKIKIQLKWFDSRYFICSQFHSTETLKYENLGVL